MGKNKDFVNHGFGSPLEKLAPSLQSCERLKQTDLPCSLLVWKDTGMRRRVGEEAPCILSVYALETRQEGRTAPYHPAPTSQELKEAILARKDVKSLRSEVQTINGRRLWKTQVEFTGGDMRIMSKAIEVDAWMDQWCLLNDRPWPSEEDEEE